MEYLDKLIDSLPFEPSIMFSGWLFGLLGLIISFIGIILPILMSRRFNKPNSISDNIDQDLINQQMERVMSAIDKDIIFRTKSLLIDEQYEELDKTIDKNLTIRFFSIKDALIEFTYEDANKKELIRSSIVDLFTDNESFEKLLILGEPGSGKTSCLLKLSRNLIDRFLINEYKLIPVVVECSDWTNKFNNLEEFIAFWVSKRYGFQKSTIEMLVKNKFLLPMFDGLDEITSTENRKKFISNLNEYSSNNGVVLCSRTSEYLQLKDKAFLNKAVVLQDLSLSKIKLLLSKYKKYNLLLFLEETNDHNLISIISRPLFFKIFSLLDVKNITGYSSRKNIAAEDLIWDLYLSYSLNEACVPIHLANKGKKFQKSWYKKYNYWLSNLAILQMHTNETDFRKNTMLPYLLDENGKVYFNLMKFVFYFVSGFILSNCIYSILESLVFSMIYSIGCIVLLETDDPNRTIIRKTPDYDVNMFYIFSLSSLFSIFSWYVTASVYLEKAHIIKNLNIVVKWLAIVVIFSFICLLTYSAISFLFTYLFRKIVPAPNLQKNEVITSNGFFWLCSYFGSLLLIPLIHLSNKHISLEYIHFLIILIVTLLSQLTIDPLVKTKIKFKVTLIDRMLTLPILRHAITFTLKLFCVFIAIEVIYAYFVLLKNGISPEYLTPTIYPTILLSFVIIVPKYYVNRPISSLITHYILYLRKFFPLDIIDFCDLLSSRKILIKSEYGYRFIHMSLQEYLASGRWNKLKKDHDIKNDLF